MQSCGTEAVRPAPHTRMPAMGTNGQSFATLTLGHNHDYLLWKPCSIPDPRLHSLYITFNFFRIVVIILLLKLREGRHGTHLVSHGSFWSVWFPACEASTTKHCIEIIKFLKLSRHHVYDAMKDGFLKFNMRKVGSLGGSIGWTSASRIQIMSWSWGHGNWAPQWALQWAWSRLEVLPLPPPLTNSFSLSPPLK